MAYRYMTNADTDLVKAGCRTYHGKSVLAPLFQSMERDGGQVAWGTYFKNGSFHNGDIEEDVDLYKAYGGGTIATAVTLPAKIVVTGVVLVVLATMTWGVGTEIEVKADAISLSPQDDVSAVTAIGGTYHFVPSSTCYLAAATANLKVDVGASAITSGKFAIGVGFYHATEAW